MNSKIQAVGWAGAATVVIVWCVGLAGVEMPPEVAAALATLLTTGAGWLKPETKEA